MSKVDPFQTTRKLRNEVLAGKDIVKPFGHVIYSGSDPDHPADPFGLLMKNCECLRRRNPKMWALYNPPRVELTPEEKMIRKEIKMLKQARSCQDGRAFEPFYVNQNNMDLSDEGLEALATQNVADAWNVGRLNP